MKCFVLCIPWSPRIQGGFFTYLYSLYTVLAIVILLSGVHDEKSGSSQERQWSSRHKRIKGKNRDRGRIEVEIFQSMRSNSLRKYFSEEVNCKRNCKRNCKSRSVSSSRTSLELTNCNSQSTLKDRHERLIIVHLESRWTKVGQVTQKSHWRDSFLVFSHTTLTASTSSFVTEDLSCPLSLRKVYVTLDYHQSFSRFQETSTVFRHRNHSWGKCLKFHYFTDLPETERSLSSFYGTIYFSPKRFSHYLSSIWLSIT
jgi:hypothetical protein